LESIPERGEMTKKYFQVVTSYQVWAESCI